MHLMLIGHNFNFSNWLRLYSVIINIRIDFTTISYKKISENIKIKLLELKDHMIVFFLNKRNLFLKF